MDIIAIILVIIILFLIIVLFYSLSVKKPKLKEKLEEIKTPTKLEEKDETKLLKRLILIMKL